LLQHAGSDCSRRESAHERVTIGVPAVADLALAAQQQIAIFFESDGAIVVDPDTAAGPFFEVPITGPLPEGLNF
jgi:hypothetical protein